MDMSEAQGWAVIIGTIFAGVASAIGVIKTGKVHTLVNSAMTAEKAENALLRSMLTAKTIENETAERVRATLAGETGHTLEKPLPVAIVEIPSSIVESRSIVVSSEAKP